jgi:hypothetical protein
MADDANQNPVDEDASDAAAPGDASDGPTSVEEPTSIDEPSSTEQKAEGATPAASRTVTRRTVQSRRVTPKGGVAKAGSTKGAPPVAASKARDAKKTEAVIDRAEHSPLRPSAYAKGPSPWWVPALMFGLLILGAVLIIANYAGAFGDPDNTYLVLGLGFILGGIITATQYR